MDVHGREGLFWDSIAGRAPVPRAAATLGFELLDADPDGGWIEVAFTATEAFTNPMGEVLGGFLAAMVYDTVGPALLATLAPDEFQETLELKTTFVAPARPGRLLGRGRVIARRDRLAFLDATLTDSSGRLVATGTATATVILIHADGDPSPEP
ncbi:PaaI family thioesterase [Tsukamurella sp. NPDC003166]|uniref:PaaI family thioesterase n=1 Tax=Tsukamurella sp. NPDC003166 TaxID=3154444 RepID=UPI0033AFD3B2